LAGVSGVLHLASPLVGKLPPAEMLDVSIHSCTYLLTVSRLTLPHDQAAVNGTLNIIKQATKLGIKNFSIISSIGAVWDRNNIKPLYNSDGMTLLESTVSNGEINFILLDRLESDHERTDSVRGCRPVEHLFRHKDFRRTCGLGIRC
jgi:hypothetical protein